MDAQAMLGRIDERTQQMQREAAALVVTFEGFRKQLTEIYVTKDRFIPVERIAYGLVGLLAGSVILAVLSLAFQHSS